MSNEAPHLTPQEWHEQQEREFMPQTRRDGPHLLWVGCWRDGIPIHQPGADWYDARVFSYELAFGEQPGRVEPLCGVAECVEPWHLAVFPHGL